MILNTLAERVTSPDEILAMLQDEHRHQCAYDPGADPDVDLTLESSIDDWRVACDLVDWSQLAVALNTKWNVQIPLDEWRVVLLPAKTKRLRGVCELLSSNALTKFVIPPHIFGRRCASAGIFYAIRELLELDGAEVSQLTPSSMISEYSIVHSHVFELDISKLAPGALPPIKIVNPDYERATFAMTLAVLTFFGSLIISIWLHYLWVPFAFALAIAILWMNHVAQHSKPTSVSFGDLKTIRDMCYQLKKGLRT